MTHQSIIQNQPGKSMSHCTRRFLTAPHRAFTLIELLVVIAIISLLMAIAFPAIAVMSRLTRGGAAETTVGIAVRTASAYAGKPKQSATNPAGGLDLESNGAAILFTPNGDMRILQSDLHAFNTTNVLLQNLLSRSFGYTDVPQRDYINLPDNAAVVGILRVAGEIKLITPPFAVHFDKFGQATTGYDATTDDARQMVFYDSDYNGQYNTADARPSTYDPDPWNSQMDGIWNQQMDDAGLRPKLPFEVIETVVGILTFQIQDFRLPRVSDGLPNSLVAVGQYLDDETTEWLLKTDPANGKLLNAKPLFFSRNSGSILKEYR